MSIINGTVIYRELGDPSPILLTWLEDRGQLFNVLDDHNNEHLYIDNDQPRDADITPMLVEATIGFSLFTEGGKRLSDYSRLDRAIRAQQGAKLVITPEVDLEEEIELEEDEGGLDALSALEVVQQERIAELEAQIAAGAPLEDFPSEPADEYGDPEGADEA